MNQDRIGEHVGAERVGESGLFYHPLFRHQICQKLNGDFLDSEEHLILDGFKFARLTQGPPLGLSVSPVGRSAGGWIR